MVEDPHANAGEIRDAGLIPESGRPFEGGPGNRLQQSCPENPYEQKSLAGYSTRGLKELDMTEATEHACI